MPATPFRFQKDRAAREAINEILKNNPEIDSRVLLNELSGSLEQYPKNMSNKEILDLKHRDLAIQANSPDIPGIKYSNKDLGTSKARYRTGNNQDVFIYPENVNEMSRDELLGLAEHENAHRDDVLKGKKTFEKEVDSPKKERYFKKIQQQISDDPLMQDSLDKLYQKDFPHMSREGRVKFGLEEINTENKPTLIESTKESPKAKIVKENPLLEVEQKHAGHFSNPKLWEAQNLMNKIRNIAKTGGKVLPVLTIPGQVLNLKESSNQIKSAPESEKSNIAIQEAGKLMGLSEEMIPKTESQYYQELRKRMGVDDPA